MKTISLKADEEFDIILNQLTSRLKTTRSEAIRNAVKNYLKQLDKQELREKIRAASLKTREQAIEASSDFDVANSDGI